MILMLAESLSLVLYINQIGGDDILVKRGCCVLVRGGHALFFLDALLPYFSRPSI